MQSRAFYLPQLWLGSQYASALLPKKILPLSAHLKLTENCQARCMSCDYWKSHWKNEISTERAIDLINEVEALGISTLRFTGGEPLLRKDFFEILTQSRARECRQIVLQTNGLLLERFHEAINASPITHVHVSIDGMSATNDLIRGMPGYFEQAIRGIKLLRGKKIGLSVTLNELSAKELPQLSQLARELGATLGFNLLSRSLFFLAHADLDALWPKAASIPEMEAFVRDQMKRPSFEVDYIRDYYNQAPLTEPACVLGYLQLFVLSNGDVLTGCYPLPPVGNILKSSLTEVLRSQAYQKQAAAMVRRECPGCTCGIESSLAMQHAVQSGFYELSRLLKKD